MKRSWVGILACFGGATLPACSPADQAADEGGPELASPGSTEIVASNRLIRGFLVLGPEVRSIKPCDRDAELWVIPTPEVEDVYESLSGEAYEAIFIEADAVIGPAPASGFGADYSGLVTIRSLRRAEPSSEGFGCTESVDEFEFRATGQEPFWHLRVAPDGLLLSTPTVPSTFFESAQPAMAAGGWEYISETSGPESLTMTAIFREGRCIDSMSGAFFSWTAELDIGGERLSGCAWEGALAPR